MDASLKQRLVGAAVLIALAVIFLPMLVKGPLPDNGAANISMKIPAEPKAAEGMATQDLPLMAPAAAPATGVSGMPNAEQNSASAATPATAPEQAVVPLPAVAAGDYAVSFGNYANVADADKVIAALHAAGLPGYREAVSLGSKQAQRVRIGPFADRALAESARLRATQVRNDVETKVVVLDAAPSAEPPAAPAFSTTVTTDRNQAAVKVQAPPAAKLEVPAAPKSASKPETPAAAKPATKPEPSKPAPSASAPSASASKPAASETPKAEPPVSKPANPAGTGFVVQMGAFASATDATALRDTLRKAGFNAFTDTVPGANGSLTRVRVGPVITRAEAEALKSKLEHAGKAGGMIRPHP